MNLKGPRPDGTAIVRTEQFTDAERACVEALDLHGLVAVRGKVGLGKTESVAQAATRVRANCIDVHLDAAARGYAFLRGFLRRAHLSVEGDGDTLLERCRDYLAAHPRTLVTVDDADFLHRDSLRHIQVLFDEADLEFGLVLTAVDFAEPFSLVPGLGSRVTSELHFTPLTERAVVESMRAYHPCWAGLPREILEQLDAEHCHGVWRDWVTMTRKVLYYQQLQGAASVTVELVGAALASRRAA